MVMTNLNNREVLHLLRRWGFEEERGNGGHLILKWPATGERVQVSAPARHMPVHVDSLSKAAKIAGVTVQQLKEGPERVKWVAPKQDFDEQSPAPAVPAASDDDEWRQFGTFSERVIAFMKTRPALTFTAEQLSERIELPADRIAPILNRLAKGDSPRLERVSRGRYRYAPPARVDLSQMEDRQRFCEIEDAVRQRRMFEKIGNDACGRAVLKDNDGQLWVAILVEPDFTPQKQLANVGAMSAS